MTSPEAPLSSLPARREDILVSVCFSDLPATAEAIAVTRALAARLDSRFRFREIVLVVEETAHEAYLPLVNAVENLRLFVVRPGMSSYRKRMIAADEAIGDVVLLTSAQELAALDPVAMIEQAAAEGRAIISLRGNPSATRTALAMPLIALGRAAGFKANARQLQTIALPSTLLNQILAHSDPELALRFPPREPRMPLGYVVARPDARLTRGWREFRSRMVMIQRLLVHMAPSLLIVVTLVSGMLSLLGFGYAFYVLLVWLFVTQIEPGWVTLSMMLSLSACFLGIAIMGLSLGLQNLWSQVNRDKLDSVAREINRIDLFGQVTQDLNVDLDLAREDEGGTAPAGQS